MCGSIKLQKMGKCTCNVFFFVCVLIKQEIVITFLNRLNRWNNINLCWFSSTLQSNYWSYTFKFVLAHLSSSFASSSSSSSSSASPAVPEDPAFIVKASCVSALAQRHSVLSRLSWLDFTCCIRIMHHKRAVREKIKTCQLSVASWDTIKLYVVFKTWQQHYSCR